MKGYLTTCDGAQFELPTLLKWEFSYTGSVPCDSFTLKCAYEPAMAEVLRRAVRFTAREDGTVEFAGVVDECGVTCDEKGLQLEVSGRGMAALLLDNEAESVSYQWATMEEILKNHVTPYGIVCTGYDAVTAAARYRVANGSSQWKALNNFAALHGGIEPYFDKTSALEVKKNRKAARVSIDAKTPVTALAYCDKRYGVIAEALVVDSKAGVKQSVKNEAFCARGGTSRRVFYVPARSGTQAMRYTGVNELLVNLFHNVMDAEAKAVITEEFKDITNNDIHILEAIGIEEPKSMSRIAGELHVTVGTLTTNMNSLEKKGYLERNRSTQDKRVVLVTLTEKGRKAFFHHRDFHRKMIHTIIRDLDEEEMKTLIKCLGKLDIFFREGNAE